jgi:hypothetical protein
MGIARDPGPARAEQDKIREALNGLTVPVWPIAGRALGLGRDATYRAARNGELPTIRIGGALRVPTAPLRRMLGLEAEAA